MYQGGEAVGEPVVSLLCAVLGTCSSEQFITSTRQYLGQVLWFAGTGDHLAYSGVAHGLTIFERYNHGGVRRQLDSVRKLLAFDFVRILPGHGRPAHFTDLAERDRAVNELLATH